MAYVEVCGNTTGSLAPNLSAALRDAGGTILLPDLYVLITGAVIFFGVLPFVLFHFRFFPIGTTTAILLGSVLLVAFQVITQEELYVIIGRGENLQLLLMLCGILILAHLVHREQIINKVLRRCLKPNQSFETYLLVVCITTFIMTALFSNDASCAIITPALLKLWESHDRHKHEVDVLLLGISTSANIASATSLYGGLHMALISTKTFIKEHFHSQLDLRTCIMFLLPTAAIIFFINFAFLLLHFRIKLKCSERTKLICEQTRSEQEMCGLTKDEPRTYTNGFVRRGDHFEDDMTPHRDERLINPCQLETILEDEVLEIQASPSLESQAARLRYIDDTSSDSSSDSDEGISSPPNSDPGDNIFTVEYRPSTALHRSDNININMNLNLTGSNNSLDRALKHQGLRIYRRLGIFRSLSGLSAVEFLQHEYDEDNESKASDSVVFHVILGVLMTCIIASYLAATGGIILDLGLIPMAAATMALLFDAILNRKSIMATLKCLDWSVVLLLLGMFVWIQGLQATNIAQYLWYKAGLENSRFTGVVDVAILFGVAMVMAAIFSNVPMTLILLMQLPVCSRQLPYVLLLAWLSSISGNLTLYSSVSASIVAQKANHTLHHKLSFWRYLQYGMVTTILLAAIGVVIISGLLRIH